MSFNNWLQNLKSVLVPGRQRNRRRRGSLRTATHRLNLEALEDRRLLAFIAPADYDVGPNPLALATADFTNDGRLDLAVVNLSDSTVSVLVGNAIVPGTFDSQVTSPTGATPHSLAVGDFNADGKLDLATANSGDVSVLLGNGNGTFQAPTNIGIGSDPGSVAVGDFNGDGLLDLGVTSNVYTPGYYTYYPFYYRYPGYYSGYANVLLGDGAGGFSEPNSTFLDYGNHNTALAADLNGDLYDDFVTLNSTYGSVTVLQGDSSGYLQPGFIYTGEYFSAVAAADLDGDGANDLVTANANSNSVGVLLGDGLGGFSGPNNYATGDYPTSIVLGDFTHDGNLDVATSSYNDSGQVSVLYGYDNGAFSSPAFSATGSYPWALAAGDFNGDGWLDAATAKSVGNLSNVSVLINDQSWPDPPPPSISINDPSAVLEGNTGSVNVTFTLTLSSAYATPITVHYATADGSGIAGSDYTAASGDVTFAPFQLTYPITVAVLGDRLAEPDETFVVNLSTTDAFIGDGAGVGAILDDEPRISINDRTITEGNTGTVNATFTVTLSASYDEDVTVHFDTANGSATAGSDYTGASGNVTVAAGSTTQTFMVAVLGDRSAEATENFVVNLSAATQGLVVDGQGVGAILDNEPRISISDVTKAEGKNGKKTIFTFTVTLSAAYDQAVTMSYRTVDGTATSGSGDYIAKTGTLTFAPGETTKTITIEVKGDNKREANETFYLDLFGLSSNSLFTKNRGIGTILNDD